MDLSGVYSALSAVHKSSTPPSVRAEADRFLQQFRTNTDPLRVIDASLQMLGDKSGDDRSFHFALQSFQSVVLKSWSTLSAEYKVMVKNQLRQFAGNELCDVTRGSGLLSATVADVMCDIATREWPQCWPEQQPMCTELSTSVSGSFIVMTFLRDQGVAIFVPSETLPSRRRAELQAGIQMNKTDIVLLLKGILDNQWSFCETGVAHASLKNRLLGTCIDALLEFYPKLPFSLLEEHCMLDYLCNYLMIPAVTGVSLEVIIALMCHRNTTAVTLVPTVTKLWLRVLHCASELLKHADSQEEEFDLLMDKVIRAVRVFISTHSEALTHGRRLGIDQIVAQIKEGTFYVLFQCTQKPSAIATYALGCINEIVRLNLSTYVQEGPRQAEQTMECLRVACRCMQKGEVDDNDEVSIRRAAALQLANLVSLARPAEAMLFVSEQACEALALQQGVSSVSEAHFHAVNALVLIADDVSKTVDQHLHVSPQFQQQPDCSQIKQSVLSSCERLLTSLVAFHSSNLDYVTVQLRLLTCTLPLLRSNSNALMQVIQICFASVQLNPEDAMGISDPAKAVARPAPLVDLRRRACYTQLQLSKKIASSFSPLLQQLKAFLTAIQPNVIPSEYIYLLEFLLTVALSSEDQEQQRKVLQAEIEPNLTALQQGINLDQFKCMLELQRETLTLYEAQINAWRNWDDKPQPDFIGGNEQAKTMRYNQFYSLNNQSAIARALRAGQEAPALVVSSLSTEDRQLLKAMNSTRLPTHTTLPYELHPLLAELVKLLLPTLLRLLLYSNTFMTDHTQKELPLQFMSLAAPTAQHQMLQLCVDASLPSGGRVPPRTHHIIRDVAVWMSQCHELILQLLFSLMSQNAIYILLNEQQDQFAQLQNSFQGVPPRYGASFITKFLAVMLQQASAQQLPLLQPIITDFFTHAATSYAPHLLLATEHPDYHPLVLALGSNYLSKVQRLRGGSVTPGAMHHTATACQCIYMRVGSNLPAEQREICHLYDLHLLCPSQQALIDTRTSPTAPPPLATRPAPTPVETEMSRADDKDSREYLTALASVFNLASNTGQHTQKLYDKINRSAQKSISEQQIWSGNSGVSFDSNYSISIICDSAALASTLSACFTLAKIHDQHSVLVTCCFIRNLTNTVLTIFARLLHAKNTGSALDDTLGPLLRTKNTQELLNILASLESCLQNTLIAAGYLLHHYVTATYKLQEPAVEEMGNILRDIIVQTTALQQPQINAAFSRTFQIQPQQMYVLTQTAVEGDGIRGRQDWTKRIQAFFKNEEQKAHQIVDQREAFVVPPKEKKTQTCIDVSKGLAEMFK